MARNSEQLDLLDLMIVLAANLKLLILGSVFVAIIAWVAVVKQTEKFASEAIISLAPNEQLKASNTLVSDQVIEAAISRLALRISRDEFREKISISRSRDGLLHLLVFAESPIEAQKRAKALIASWMSNSMPSEQERNNLEKRLALIRSEHLYAMRLLEETALKSNQKNGYAVNPDALSKLLETEAEYLKEMLAISQSLSDGIKNSVIQEPTFRNEAVGPQKKLVVLSASFFAFAGLLAFIFMRFFWHRASFNPVLAEKQKKLIAAFRR